MGNPKAVPENPRVDSSILFLALKKICYITYRKSCWRYPPLNFGELCASGW